MFKSFVSFFFILLISCSGEVIYKNIYFPVNKGSIWSYNKFIIHKNKVDICPLKLIMIESSAQFKNFITFKYYKSNTNDELCNEYTIFHKNFRTDSLMNVIEYIDSYFYIYDIYGNPIKMTTSEQIKYKFSANVGDKWNYIYVDNDTKYNDLPVGIQFDVSLISKTDTIHYMGKQIKDCYKFFFSCPNGSDMDYYEWFAPNVGLIKSSSIYGEIGTELDSYWYLNK